MLQLSERGSLVRFCQASRAGVQPVQQHTAAHCGEWTGNLIQLQQILRDVFLFWWVSLSSNLSLTWKMWKHHKAPALPNVMPEQRYKMIQNGQEERLSAVALPQCHFVGHREALGFVRVTQCSRHRTTRMAGRHFRASKPLPATCIDTRPAGSVSPVPVF